MGDEISESAIKIVTEDEVEETATPPSILTNLHAGYFRISLSLGGQAILWKTLTDHFYKPPTAAAASLHYHIYHTLTSTTFMLLWCLTLCALLLLSFLYALRCFFHFSLVKAEFCNYVGINYFFAPWVSWLLLLQSFPFAVFRTSSYYQVLWWLMAVPVVILDLKIYGQWFTTEKRFLSMVANPTTQMSVFGNLTGAWAASHMGWKESGVCMFTLGMCHYLVVFITLYQRLSGGNRIPATLRPVFFLFVAAPSMGSLAWSSISGNFDMPSKMLFFLSMFLFTSLVCRPTLFKKSMRRFNIAWWAYSFPLTFLALASAHYARQVKSMAASALMLLLSALSIIVFVCLLLFTALNANSLLRRQNNHPCLHFSKHNLSL
ncbi:PREDICTED: S-type anion channel SLAH4-like [Ipomoea nil]|uniref:S-type anion channel SLAH4-like n=1 Tax=Ipomoea nil TaxID=35883 RepID=UPI000901370D|nr:PREDICTED: S-type anion channel SLAH4-like [Ipomoea nil]